MQETFLYTENKVSARFAASSVDIKWRPRIGPSVVKWTWTGTLKKGSMIDQYYSLNLSIDAMRDRAAILGDLNVERPEEGQHDFYELREDFDFNGQAVSPSHICQVISGSKRSGPHHLEHEKLGMAANHFVSLMHIEKQTGLEIDLERLEGLFREHELEKIPFSDFVHRELKASNGQASLTDSEIPIVEEIADLLELKNNVILEGVPGVGKTWIMDKLKQKLGIEDSSGRFRSITFSPSSGPEEFIGGLFPTASSAPPTFKFNEGVLLKIAMAAAKDQSKRPYLLFIDEINRGNIAKIMGQIMTVIESKKRFEPNGSRQVLVDGPDDVPYRATLFTNGKLSQRLGLPSNLYIVGAMNTSDRSVVQIDGALRRRFAFVRLPTLLTQSNIPSLLKALERSKSKIWTETNLKSISPFLKLLAELNLLLKNEIGVDGQLGHSYLFDAKYCMNAGSEPTATGEAPEDDRQLWKSMGDMLQYSLLPQVADILNSNGVSNHELPSKAEQCIDFISEKSGIEQWYSLRSPIGVTGEWRVE
jgi:MoxR-like ATPase